MRISESELIDFANDPINEIDTGKCLENAMRVYKKYSGQVYIGDATYLKSDGSRKTFTHYWNVIRYIAEEREVVQLIDIINYKGGTSGVYINHREATISSETLNAT